MRVPLKEHLFKVPNGILDIKLRDRRSCDVERQQTWSRVTGEKRETAPYVTFGLRCRP